MNTNTMELNMNEMEMVNGGDLIDSLSRIGEAMIITHVGKEKERRSKPTVVSPASNQKHKKINV